MVWTEWQVIPPSEIFFIVRWWGIFHLACLTFLQWRHLSPPATSEYSCINYNTTFSLVGRIPNIKLFMAPFFLLLKSDLADTDTWSNWCWIMLDCIERSFSLLSLDILIFHCRYRIYCSQTGLKLVPKRHTIETLKLSVHFQFGFFKSFQWETFKKILWWKTNFQRVVNEIFRVHELAETIRWV